MMKTLSSLVLSFVMLTQTTMANVYNAKLQNVFDRYQYQIGVEWDQQDREVLENIRAELVADLTQLAKEGMQQEELVSFIADSLNDRGLASEFEILAQDILGGVYSQTEAQDLLSEFAAQMEDTGANFRSRRTTNAVVTSLILALGVVAFAFYFRPAYR